MKILMVCTEKLPLPPIRGGAIQTYISGALPYLKKKHDITVLGVNDPSLPDEEMVEGIRYVRIPGKLFEIYKEGVMRYVGTHSFDLIHIFNRPKLVMPVRQAAPHSKITLSMHNDMFKLEKIEPEEATKAIKEISQIVTISNYIGDVIRSQYPQASQKLHTIYSGVDTERFLPGKHPGIKKIRDSMRREHGLENKTVILFAGRISRNKGVDRLVRALPELSKRYKDLALVIVGSKWFSQNDVTDYVAYVRALAKKLPIPVVNTGFVSPFDIQNWFAAADVFVCTSVWQEPLARVHYEAMSAGLPIITTNRGGNAEVIQSKENGLLVENIEEPANLVEKLAELLSNRSLMKRMGEKGRELAVSRYKWDRVASDILNVWELAEQNSIQVPDMDAMNALPPEKTIETEKGSVINGLSGEQISQAEDKKINNNDLLSDRDKAKKHRTSSGDDNKQPKKKKRPASLFDPAPKDDSTSLSGKKGTDYSRSKKRKPASLFDEDYDLFSLPKKRKKPASLFEDSLWR